MAIRKLEVEEIKNIMEEIQKLRNNEYYKYYFDGTVENFPDEAYMINDYYIDFTYYNGLCFMGAIKLKNNPEVSYYKFFNLVRNRLKEYKIIYQWAFLENKPAIKFHKILVNKFGARQKVIKNISLIELREGDL